MSFERVAAPSSSDAVAWPRASLSTHVSALSWARDTMSHRSPSCWKASRPMAFSPRVRSSPTFWLSKRLRASSRRRSGDIPRPSSSTAMTGRWPLRRRMTRIRAPRSSLWAYSSAALETNSLRASLGSWYACPVTSTALAKLPMRSRTVSALDAGFRDALVGRDATAVTRSQGWWPDSHPQPWFRRRASARAIRRAASGPRR